MSYIPKSRETAWAGAMGALGGLLLTSGVALADVELPCTVSFAEEMSDPDDEFELDLGRIDDFCECKVVTPGFTRHIQQRSNFADILSRSTDLCPDVASAISQPATVATAAAPAAAAGASGVSGGSSGGGQQTSGTGPGTGTGTGAVFGRWAGLASQPAVPPGATRCTVNYAMGSIDSGAYSDLCDCDIVTLGFVRYLQGRSDIGDILDQTAGQCTDLAVVLSETPVAGFFRNQYIAEDPRGAAPGTCSEAVCGGNEYGAVAFDAPTPPPPVSIAPPPVERPVEPPVVVTGDPVDTCTVCN